MPSNPIKYLTQSELKRFFSVIDTPRERAMFGAIYHYGLRVTEATLINLSDVDFERGTIFIHRVKGGVGGVRLLLPDLKEALKSYLSARQPTGDALFTGRQGNLSRHRIGQLFKFHARKAALLGYSVHCLRHSLATHMLEGGFDLTDVQYHLGHKRIESTLIYTHITNNRITKIGQQMQKSRAIVKV